MPRADAQKQGWSGHGGGFRPGARGGGITGLPGPMTLLK